MRQRKHMFADTPAAKLWKRAEEMWQCPACGKQYPRRGQSHSCGDVALDEHFLDRPRARQLFDAFAAAMREECGLVRLSSARSRIGFITGITFAAIKPRNEYLRGHLLLATRRESDRFMRIDDGPPYWVHHFEIRDESDLDPRFRRYLRESYAVGRAKPRSKPR